METEKMDRNDGLFGTEDGLELIVRCTPTIVRGEVGLMGKGLLRMLDVYGVVETVGRIVESPTEYFKFFLEVNRLDLAIEACIWGKEFRQVVGEETWLTASRRMKAFGFPGSVDVSNRGLLGPGIIEADFMPTIIGEREMASLPTY